MKKVYLYKKRGVVELNFENNEYSMMALCFNKKKFFK